jgi:cysteinyl-tRNA synthetase, unknown class
MRRLLSILSALGLAAVAFVPGAADAQTRENRFLNAKSWAFQLKNLGPAEQAKIAASPFDLVVIDASQFVGEKEVPLTKAEVERMKVKPDGSKRMVIAYFSVGEAENYRSYWKPEWNKTKPAWVGKENKEWKDNFLVKYWEPTWQAIVFPFADRIIDSGFDGFYIDRVDAYYYYGDTKDMRDRMAAFIIKLTNHMRTRKPDVQILSQNAEELLDRPNYVAAIDGIAKEDLLYGITHKEEPNKKADVDWSGKLMSDFKKQGKAVFVIEYLTRADYVKDAKARLDTLGFVMYMGPRGLASLNVAAADIGAYAGPRRGPLDPTPENPTALTPVGKAKNAVRNAVAVTKERASAAAAKVKAAVKPATPAKTN